MMKRVIAGTVLLASLSGCGVKNLPVAPKTQATPAVAAQQTRAGTTQVLGAPDPNVDIAQPNAIPVDRISDLQEDDEIKSAAVTRNSNARGKSFFLDGLLN